MITEQMAFVDIEEDIKQTDDDIHLDNQPQRSEGDIEEDIKQTDDDIHLDNQPQRSEGKDQKGQSEVMSPVEGCISFQERPEVESPPEEIKKGEDTKHPVLNDERLENLQEEAKGDGLGSDQSDGEEEDPDTNKIPEKVEISKSKCEDDAHPVAGHTSSHVTPQVTSPPEENIRADCAPFKSSQQCEEDVVIRGKDTVTRRLIKKEEHKRPTEEHSGEGDSPRFDQKETSPPSVKAQDSHDTKSIFILAALFAVLAVFGFLYMRPEPPPVQQEFNLLDVFRHEMDKVQSSFPSQHKELWRRSRIHLQRHLQMSHPSEPVSLILTSGRGAEKTLGCLAQQLAAAFSTALNASALDIDGTSKAAQDSDQVKLDIDRALREAFDGGKQAAVIHRFEELPPGSTLIFYRYCDHENAAYKNVFLAFTVLLEEDLEVPPNVSLGMVEEVVQEYLKEKFVSSERTAMFNQMDVDKLSGLWSRISHLILPVAAEQTIEQDGCGGSG